MMTRTAVFLAIQRNLGTVGPTATHANGDTNGDDAMNSADIGVWEAQHGTQAPQTFLDKTAFLAAAPGPTLYSFESNPATNTRDKTQISEFSGAPFRLESTADMGVWAQPPADFMGTHPTDGVQWVVSPVGGSVTLVMDPYQPALAIGSTITDFGDTPGSYLMEAEVHFLYGDVNTYTLAVSSGADGNVLFAGIVAEHQPITKIVLTYGPDEVGLDEYYVLLAPPLAAAASVPEPTTLLLFVAAALLLPRRGR